MPRLLRIVGNAAMAVVVLIAVAFAALSLMSKGDPSDTRTWAGGFKPFVVLSGSMEPAIPVGGVLLVRRTTAAMVRREDIITFVTPQAASALSQPPSVTTHRVVGVTTDAGGALAFNTKGDANEDPDAMAVPAANVLGSAVLSVPYLGYVSRFASTREGLLALIVFPALLLMVIEVVSIARGRHRKDAPRAAGEG